MSDRSGDWFNQALRNLEQATASQTDDRHEWACFAAQQAAELAVRALHLKRGQEAWGHSVARLLTELPLPVPAGLVDQVRYNSSTGARRPPGVHREEERTGLVATDSRFARVLRDETVWIV